MVFKEGDIVSHVSGRISNGRYGVIEFALGELMVVDNEGALHSSAILNEKDFTVVRNIRENVDLLKEMI